MHRCNRCRVADGTMTALSHPSPKAVSMEPWATMRRSSRIPFRGLALHSHRIKCSTRFSPPGKRSPQIRSIRTIHSAEPPVSAQKRRCFTSPSPAMEKQNTPGAPAGPTFQSTDGPVLPVTSEHCRSTPSALNSIWTPKCLLLHILRDIGWRLVGTPLNAWCLFLMFWGGSSVAPAIVN